MSILTIAWSMCAAANAMLALTHLFLWMKDRSAHVYGLSVAMAAGASATTVTELLLLHAREIPVYARILVWQNAAVYVLLVSMVWYVYLRFGTARRWLAFAITTLWTVAIVINFVSPASVVFAQIDELWRPTAFWGEPFTLVRGVENPWVHLPNAASVLIVVYLVDASLRVRRREGGSPLFRVGLAMTVFILAGGIHTPLVDAGVVATPYMISFAFLAIVLALSYELVDEAFHAARYAREIEAAGVRWRTLLDNVQAAGGRPRPARADHLREPVLRAHGRAHRHGAARRGCRAAGAGGRSRRARGGRRRRLRRPARRAAREPGPRRRRRGAQHRLGRTVLLRDADGVAQEVLAVGADVTDRRDAEAARDRALASTRAALAEVEELRGRLEEAGAVSLERGRGGRSVRDPGRRRRRDALRAQPHRAGGAARHHGAHRR